MTAARYDLFPDLTPPRPQDIELSDCAQELWSERESDADAELAVGAVERAAKGIAAILSFLSPADRVSTVQAVLRGMEGVTNG